MGRGSSDQVASDYNLIAARGGDLRGTELEKIGTVELDDQEWVALKALVSLAYEYPTEAGYRSQVIAETARGFAVAPAQQFEDGDADRIAAALEKAGLIEKTNNVLDVDTDQLHEEEPGWKPKPAGVQLIGAFMTADWSPGSISISS